MGREIDGYRDELEQILTYFGDKRVLSTADVAKYTGKSYDWCKAKFGISRNHPISATQLARALVRM